MVATFCRVGFFVRGYFAQIVLVLAALIFAAGAAADAASRARPDAVLLDGKIFTSSVHYARTGRGSVYTDFRICGVRRT